MFYMTERYNKYKSEKQAQVLFNKNTRMRARTVQDQ